MKQTAVEWLVEILNSKYGNDDFIITHINEIQQAKETEKQQIIDAWCQNAWIGKEPIKNLAEQYYNETYNKE